MEVSNADVGTNLIDLITASTMYEANSRVITTTQQLYPGTTANRRCRSRSNAGNRMIKLTKLGGETFVLNADLIRYVEARPDTFITLTSGERLVVAESMDEVVRRAVAYQQAKHLVPGLGTAGARLKQSGAFPGEENPPGTEESS